MRTRHGPRHCKRRELEQESHWGKALGRPLWIDNARVRRPTGLSRQLDSTSMGESMGASGQSINLTSLAKKLEGVFLSEG